MSGVMVHSRHVRAAKVCMGGSRRWCAANGVPWGEFLERGLSADYLRAFNDPIVNRAIAEAEKEASNG